jgi:hypothetical protein
VVAQALTLFKKITAQEENAKKQIHLDGALLKLTGKEVNVNGSSTKISAHE